MTASPTCDLCDAQDKDRGLHSCTCLCDAQDLDFCDAQDNTQDEQHAIFKWKHPRSALFGCSMLDWRPSLFL
eukprot:1162071-Pelagomonas_calceolata.AAC.1